MNTTEKGLEKYKRNLGEEELVRRKLFEYIPIMIITNLSVLLISSVDGIIAGNFVGKEAFSSINIFFPISVFIGAFSTIAACGISTSISTAIGRNDTKAVSKIKGASFYIMIGMALLVGLIQIPINIIIINSYGLSPDMHHMIWQYAIGLMLSAPFSLISTVGTLQLQVAGRMKVLMTLTITEALANLAFDLLFVAVFHLGVAGTGFGTLAANLIRCSSTVIYLWKKTDFYKTRDLRPDPRLFGSILKCGLPDAAFPIISAVQNYIVLRIVMNIFGMDGGVINGSVSFCLNLANVLILGIQSGLRPLMGLFVGAKDTMAVKEILRQGAVFVFLIIGTVTLLFELLPGLVFSINGIREIPQEGFACLRIFSILFIFRGLSFLFRLYLSVKEDIRFTTALTLGGNALVPVFAFLISLITPGPFVYISYAVSELIILMLFIMRYRKLMLSEESLDRNTIVLYLSVKPEDAVEASRHIRRFADEKGISPRISYKIALCVEEMVAYVRSANSLVSKTGFRDQDDVTSAVILIRFLDKNNAVFATLDNGQCIALDQDTQKEALITDNYNLIKKLADQVNYQYVLNLNYTTFTFKNKAKK